MAPACLCVRAQRDSANWSNGGANWVCRRPELLYAGGFSRQRCLWTQLGRGDVNLENERSRGSRFRAARRGDFTRAQVRGDVLEKLRVPCIFVRHRWRATWVRWGNGSRDVFTWSNERFWNILYEKNIKVLCRSFFKRKWPLTGAPTLRRLKNCNWEG